MASKQKRIPASTLLHDPRYYLFDTLPQLGETRFLLTEEGSLAEAPFADIRFEPQAVGKLSVTTRELVQMVRRDKRSRPPTHYIFHHAFVCSTLLARCLHQIDAFYALKEPWILRRLADIKRRHGSAIPEAHWRNMINTYLPLLAKDYVTGQALVIKATNVANNLIADLVRYYPDQKLLYLYSDIASFLVSNLKKPQSTQEKMPELLEGFLQDSDLAKRHAAMTNPDNLSFLQTCALIWVCNIYALRQNTQRQNFDGLRTLNMESLLSEPEIALAGVCRHFNYSPSVDDVALMTHDHVMRTNAKDTGHQYGPEQKKREHSQVYDSCRDDIEKVLVWITPVVQDLELDEFLKEFALTDKLSFDGQNHD